MKMKITEDEARNVVCPFMSGADWIRCPNATSNDERYLNLAGGHGFHGDRVVFVRNIGKSNAGRYLDGQTWDQMPGMPDDVQVIIDTAGGGLSPVVTVMTEDMRSGLADLSNRVKRIVWRPLPDRL